MKNSGPRLSFSFSVEADPGEHRIDADVLAQALLHAQRAVHLLAMTAAGREYRERLRVPAEIADEFRLICNAPQAGSYVQEVLLRGSGTVLDVPSRSTVLQTFAEVGTALSAGSWETLRHLVPDSATRQRVVDEYVALLPPPESGYGLDLVREGAPDASFRRPQILALREYSRRAREPRGFPSAPVTIVGELVSIDFGAHMFSLRHYPSDRRISCEYRAEAEEMLIRNRRGLLQVTGILERDRRDRPARMTDVYNIEEIDLSPIHLSAVKGKAVRLRFRDEPFQFDPMLDAEGELLVVEQPQIDVHAYAATRSELIAEISNQVEFLWLEYVETDEPLTSGASALRGRLMEILERVADA